MQRDSWLPAVKPLSTHQLLWRINNYYHRQLRIICTQHDVTYLQYAIMIELTAQPKGAVFSYRHLSVCLQVPQQTVVNAVTSGRRKGLFMVYTRAMFDERAQVIKLKLSDVRRLKQIEVAMQVVEAELRDALSETGVHRLRELYGVILAEQEPRVRTAWWLHGHPDQAWKLPKEP